MDRKMIGKIEKDRVGAAFVFLLSQDHLKSIVLLLPDKKTRVKLTKRTYRRGARFDGDVLVSFGRLNCREKNTVNRLIKKFGGNVDTLVFKAKERKK